MKRIAVLVVLAALPLAGRALAAESWSVSGQIRHRFEADNREFGTRDGRTYGLLRSRLNLQFDPSPDVSALVQIQDSRIMGEESSTLTDGSADNLDFHQAYARIQKVFGLPVDGRIGRMEVSYGSERLIGAVGWHNIGRSFDGIVAGIVGPPHMRTEVFYFTEAESLQAGDRGDRRVFGLYGDVAPWSGGTLQPFLIWQLQVPTSSLSRFTAGFRHVGTTKGLRHEVELAYQGGHLTRHDEVGIEAWMGALNLSYSFPDVSTKPDLSAGIDYLSGDDEPDRGKVRVFDTLYATNHKFYGFMDYFVNIPSDTFGGGLLDAHAAASFRASHRLGLSQVYHLFRAARRVDLGEAGRSRDFGQEVDITAQYAYNETVSLSLGGSTFLPGFIFETKCGDKTSTWFYVMTTMTF